MSQKRIPLPLFRTILFATDLSEQSRAAFDVACALARAEATRLIVLHVNEPVPALEQLTAYGEFGVPVFLPQEAPPGPGVIREQLASRFVPSAPIPVEYQVADGLAADQILQVAEQTDSDLIVLGTHGRRGLDRFLMGSVAEAVMRCAPVPVLTVRSDAGQLPKTLRTIMHATDFSGHAEAALRVARALACEHGTRLVLTHVVEQGVVPTSASLALVQLDLGHEALDSLQARTEGSDLKCPVEAWLRAGDPASEILAAAAELRCDLIVMGTHGRTGLGRLLTGSVAEKVLRGAACPVLTLKWPVIAGSPCEPVAVGAEA